MKKIIFVIILVLFPALASAENYRSIGPAIVIGDSTIAAYGGTTAVPSLLAAIPDTDLTNITNVSYPGDTINQQKARYEGLDSAVKSSAIYVIIQIGLNDVGYTESTTTVMARYQALIDSISTNSPDAKIYTSTMSPCKARLIVLFGETNGATAYQQWLEMNTAITGSGDDAVTGVDGYIASHTTALNDGNGNLSATYDLGDGIHENDTARQIIANAWSGKLIADNVWYLSYHTLGSGPQFSIGSGATVTIQ